MLARYMTFQMHVLACVVGIDFARPDKGRCEMLPTGKAIVIVPNAGKLAAQLPDGHDVSAARPHRHKRVERVSICLGAMVRIRKVDHIPPS